jgi:hypothetical protein
MGAHHLTGERTERGRETGGGDIAMGECEGGIATQIGNQHTQDAGRWESSTAGCRRTGRFGHACLSMAYSMRLL